MLDSFQRITVETIRRHRGKISLLLDDENKTSVSTAFADERLNKDIAIALQGYFQRRNAYYGEEDKADL